MAKKVLLLNLPIVDLQAGSLFFTWHVKPYVILVFFPSYKKKSLKGHVSSPEIKIQSTSRESHDISTVIKFTGYLYSSENRQYFIEVASVVQFSLEIQSTAKALKDWLSWPKVLLCGSQRIKSLCYNQAQKQSIIQLHTAVNNWIMFSMCFRCNSLRVQSDITWNWWELERFLDSVRTLISSIISFTKNWRNVSLICSFAK